MAADSSELAPDFAELPPELWHKIAYDFAGLKAADIAALRQASPRRLAREVFTAAGHDRVLWESAAGVRWCRDNDRPAALVVCLRRTGINPNLYHLPRWAAEGNHVGAMAHLLEDSRVDPGAILPNWYNEMFWSAADAGSVEVMKLLLADGRANPAERDYATVKRAACNETPEVLHLLLADPRVPKTTHA